MSRNPKAITESQVSQAVKAKVERMEMELKRNPHNVLTAQRLAEFKKIHKSKLISKKQTKQGGEGNG